MTQTQTQTHTAEAGDVTTERCIGSRDAFPERRGDWMQTFTGRRFWPLDPRPEDVDIRDIAHALSLLTRYGGHCGRFYSVAEHCVHLARAARPEHTLWLLLHDGSEAYLSDMVRPLKRHMPEYRAAEDRVAWAVYEAFGMDPGNEPSEVKALDNRILMDERAQNMRPTEEVWNYGGATEPLGVTLEFWSPDRAEREFLSLYAATVGDADIERALAPADQVNPGGEDTNDRHGRGYHDATLGGMPDVPALLTVHELPVGQSELWAWEYSPDGSCWRTAITDYQPSVHPRRRNVRRLYEAAGPQAPAASAGEPFFVLLGRDPQAPALVERWATGRQGAEPNSGKVTTARAIAARMRAFKTANPDLGMPAALAPTVQAQPAGREEIAQRVAELRAFANKIVAGHPGLQTLRQHVRWLDEGLCEIDRELTALSILIARSASQSLTASTGGIDLREAVKPFIAHYAPWMDKYVDSEQMTTFPRVTFGELRRLRAIFLNISAENAAS